MTQEREQKENREKISRETEYTQSQEEEIIRWIDNTVYDETEEIFKFLTEERKKFLTNYNFKTNHTNHNSSNDNTPPLNQNSPTKESDMESNLPDKLL